MSERIESDSTSCHRSLRASESQSRCSGCELETPVLVPASFGDPHRVLLKRVFRMLPRVRGSNVLDDGVGTITKGRLIE